MKANLRAVLAIVRKDLALFRRRPIAILLSVTPPLIFLLVIFGSAAAVGHNPVALVVEDTGPHATALADSIASSEAFRVRRATAAEADRLLNNLDVSAVITVPAGFEAHYLGHEADPVVIHINNLNLDFTNDLRRSLPAAIASFYSGMPSNPVSVQMDEVDLRARDISLVQFELIPDLVLLILVAGAVNGGLGTALEFESQTMRSILLSPASRPAIIVGKLVAGWVTSLLVAAVVIGVGAVSGLLRPHGWYWLSTLGIAALLALASSCIGAALGARLRQMAKVAPVAINLSIWLFFLGGGIGVAAFLPAWVQNIAAFTPTFYAVHALQMAVFYDSADQLGRDVVVLAVTALVATVVGSLSLRRTAMG